MPSTPPLDVELLAGICVIVVSVGTAIFTAARCCMRILHRNAPKTVVSSTTTPRYVLASETTAINARRYLLDANLEFHVSATCAQCRSKPSTTIFADCGHSMACPSCAHDIWKSERKCPVCNCTISAIMHIVAHNINTARVEEMVAEN